MPDDVHGRRDFPDAALATNTEPSPRVLVVDADPALFDLIAEWLGGEGCRVFPPRGDGALPGPVSLIIVDVPFPRQGGLDRLKRLAAGHREAPVLALSSTFFSGVESSGAVARSLGVAGVLPKPLARDALVAAVRSLLRTERAGTS